MRQISRETVEEDISIHIFSASAAMVGVCLTVIGILRIIISAKSISTFADDVLSLDALLFLGSCVLAYTALRANGSNRMRRVERAADGLFIAALALMAVVCALITYSVF